MLESDQYNGHYYPIDIWGLGCLMHHLLFGIPPFKADTLKKTYDKIRIGDLQLPKTIRITQNGENLLYQLLCQNPEQRIKLDKVLSHPWFKGPEFLPPRLPPELMYSKPSQKFMKQIENQAQMLNQNPE